MKGTTTHPDDTLGVLERFGCNLNELEESEMVAYLITLVIDGAAQDGERILAAFDKKATQDLSLTTLREGLSIILRIKLTIVLDHLKNSEKVELLTFLASNPAIIKQLRPLFMAIDPLFQPQLEQCNSETTIQFEAVFKSIDVVRRCSGLAVFRLINSRDTESLTSLIESFPTLVEVMDVAGRTLLSVAAEKGKIGMVRYLLDKHVSTQTLDNFGRTALYWAARAGHIDVVKLLVDAGAGLTEYAVGVGALYGHENITEYLREHARSGGIRY